MSTRPQRPTPELRPILVLAAAFMSSLASRAVLATPPSNSGVHLVNYTLVIDPDAIDPVQINLPGASEYEEDAPLSRGTRSPSVFVFEDNVFDPNGNTGWHYHPGIVLATVAEGSVDWYDAQCVKHVRKAGDFFMESDRAIHEVRNSGTVPARLIITFIVAKGLTFKISAPAPPCAAALGLN
jgi:quercetin dioxygenase-like cupin family protein